MTVPGIAEWDSQPVASPRQPSRRTRRENGQRYEIRCMSVFRLAPLTYAKRKFVDDTGQLWAASFRQIATGYAAEIPVCTAGGGGRRGGRREEWRVGWDYLAWLCPFRNLGFGFCDNEEVESCFALNPSAVVRRISFCVNGPRQT